MACGAEEGRKQRRYSGRIRYVFRTPDRLGLKTDMIDSAALSGHAKIMIRLHVNAWIS